MKTNIIIFGGDGDLSLKKIFPALFKRIIDKQGQVTDFDDRLKRNLKGYE